LSIYTKFQSKDKGIPRWWGKMAFPYEKRFFSHLIDSASKTFGVDPLFFVSIVREESRFNPKTTSPAGAIGLAQVMPENVKEFSKTFKKRVKNPYEPKINLLIGAWEISKYLNIFQDYYLALACYNAGCGALSRWLCDYEYERLDFDVFVDVIPYNETRAYVRRVMRSYWVYKSLYFP
jgi:Soluble lytic murein transglycosylase and related regulatory proteins (some contain LysM/invasin domains)